MIHLDLAGPDTRLCSTLCAACPVGPTGCCTAPPEHDWSDIGRVVAHGGRDFLLAEIARGNLVPVARGLTIRRVKKRESPLAPRRSKCVYHGAEGCTIAPGLRPATCNYFLCDDAYREGGEGRGDGSAVAARAAHGALAGLYQGWDRALGEAVRTRWPEGVPWDGAFLDWLGAAYTALATATSAKVFHEVRGLPTESG
jgi:hypothetical protein